MNTTTTLLPATNIAIPASAYSISALKTLNTMDGYAYTARILEGTRIVAYLEQQGNGGQTFAHWTTPQDEANFNAYAAKYEGKWGVTDFSPEGFDWDTESVIEALVAEVILRRELDRRAKTAILFLEPDCNNPSMAYNRISKATADHPRLTEIMAKVAPNYTHIWHNGRWETRA